MAMISIVLLIVLVESDPFSRAIPLLLQKTFAQEEIQPPTLSYPDITDSYGSIHQHQHHHHPHHLKDAPMDPEINPTILAGQGQW
jgi:hypothetical protein